MFLHEKLFSISHTPLKTATRTFSRLHTYPKIHQAHNYTSISTQVANEPPIHSQSFHHILRSETHFPKRAEFRMEEKLCLPRRPGVYPPDYPLERILEEAPTPGVPLVVSEAPQPRRKSLPSCGRPAVTGPERTAMQKMVNETLMKRAKKSDVTAKPSGTDFPPLTVKIPKFKQKTYQYPSGNATGLANFPPFEAQLLKMSKEKV